MYLRFKGIDPFPGINSHPTGKRISNPHQLSGRAYPLMNLLQEQIRSGPLINIDETPVQVMNEPGRSNTSQSYMWVFRGGVPDKPVLIYQYHPTRSGQVPGDFLKGYQGYIQTDRYNGSDALSCRPGVYLVGCWAHVRRKFMEVVKASSGTGK
jgi:transposase